MQLSDGRVYAESPACLRLTSLCLNWTANFGGITLKGVEEENRWKEVRMERYFGATFDSGAQTFADSAHSSSSLLNELSTLLEEVGMHGVRQSFREFLTTNTARDLLAFMQMAKY